MARKKIKFKKLLQTLVLFVFAITWFNSANASFLCVGSDGHTAVENIYSECHQAEFTRDTKSFELSSQHDCHDTLLLNTGLNSGSNHFENIQSQDLDVATHPFIKTNITTVEKPYLLSFYFQIDNKPKLFTDSIRLII